jgi:hypothetical protein
LVAAKPVGAGEQQEMPVRCAPDHRHADLLRDLVTHLRQARARHEERDAHLRGLDHHLGSKAPRGVENLVVAFAAVEPHLAGDRIDGVVAPDVLDELQDLRMRADVRRERAAVHGARLLVDRLVHAHLVEQVVERRPRERRIARETHVVDVLHQVAKHGSLPAAARLRALRRLRLEIGEAAARLDRHRIRLPVDLDGDDLVEALHEALIAQVPDRERLGRRAERHQRQDFLLVDVERERMLAGYGHVAHRAVLVDGGHVERRGAGGVGEQRRGSDVIHAAEGAGCYPPIYDISMRDSRGVAALRISE